MTKKRIQVVGAKVLIMSLIFKENYPKPLNTRVIDIVTEFNAHNSNENIYDSWVVVEAAL